MIRIALFEPDIPQNAGAILRLAACFNVGVDIIEPCGFVWSDKGVKRVAMDYPDHLQWQRHADWQSFYQSCQTQSRRLILLTVKAEKLHYDMTFTERDVLLLGRESSGAPEFVHEAVNERVRVPMAAEVRSLNIATAAAIVLSESVRQIGYKNLL